MGYGVFPEETIALIRERGIACVRGNWDRWAVGDGTPEDAFDMRPRDASGFELSREARRFLHGLPRVLRRVDVARDRRVERVLDLGQLEGLGGGVAIHEQRLAGEVP